MGCGTADLSWLWRAVKRNGNRSCSVDSNGVHNRAGDSLIAGSVQGETVQPGMRTHIGRSEIVIAGQNCRWVRTCEVYTAVDDCIAVPVDCGRDGNRKE